MTYYDIPDTPEGRLDAARRAGAIITNWEQRMTLNLTPCTEHIFLLGMNEVVTINGVPFVHIGSGMVMGYTDPEVARRKAEDEPGREQDTITSAA